MLTEFKHNVFPDLISEIELMELRNEDSINEMNQKDKISDVFVSFLVLALSEKSKTNIRATKNIDNKD